MGTTINFKLVLAKKIASHRATVGVIGLGYVGLPLAVAFAQKGFTVLGIDHNIRKVAQLRKGVTSISDVNAQVFKTLVRSHKITFASDDASMSRCDCLIICVPTPLNKVKEPDISYVLSAVAAVKKRLKRGQLVILESTIYPGTTEEIVLPEFTANRFRVGRDFFLCFSPERIDPGNKEYPFHKIPKVVGGVTKNCTHLASDLYGQVIRDIVPVSSPRVAETAKLLENTFRIVNIGLMNELVPAAQRLGVNLWEAIDAAKTKPFGFMPFYPGPGIGGHCIGIDPLYLSWKAKAVGSELRFVELASRVNSWMPNYVIRRIIYALNSLGRPISKSRTLILGVSYKKNVGDVRESPALEIIQELQSLGAKVTYHDPHVKALQLETGKLHSVPLTARSLKKQDLAVVLSAHTRVNYELVLRQVKRVLDTRNALNKYSKYKPKIELL
jgi:UDP-N-acetyl-D-glucosamine dehydrogenase